MSRLEELLLKWQDQSISEDELRELTLALKQPENRRRLLESFSFDANLIQALQSLKAVEQTAESVQQFETLELREADRLTPATRGRWTEKIRALLQPIFGLSHR